MKAAFARVNGLWGASVLLLALHGPSLARTGDEAGDQTLAAQESGQATQVKEARQDAREAERFKLSGFGTVGYVDVVRQTHDWWFQREMTQRYTDSPWLPDSRLGVQVNWSITPQLDAVGQVVARARPSGASKSSAIEWAFLAWRPTGDAQMRIGRVSPDMFLLADVRNVAFSYPWVRPSVEFYGWMPFSSVDGADVTYRWQGLGGDWRIKALAGQGKAHAGSANADTAFRAAIKDMGLLSLSGEFGGTTIKSSYTKLRTAVTNATSYVAAEQFLHTLTQLPVPLVAQEANQLLTLLNPSGPAEYFALGLQHEGRHWVTHAEYSRLKLGSRSQQQAYVSVGYTWSKFMVYAMTARTKPGSLALPAASAWEAALTPVIGPVAAAQAGAAREQILYAARYDQSTHSLGLRWNVLTNSALKLQVDRVSVQPHGATAWANASSQDNRATVVSASLDFVF